MIIFSHKFGQLGNRLFAFAHLIANAAANNHTVVNLSFDEYAKYFESTCNDSLCRYPPVESFARADWVRSTFFFLNRAILKVLRNTGAFQSRLHKIIVADLPDYQFGDGRFYELASPEFQRIAKATPAVLLFGRFFRDDINFEIYKDIIRTYFRPIPEVRGYVDKLMITARADSDLVIGVHIRRGDYAQYANGRYFFSHQQYAEKIHKLQSDVKTRKILYVICSNEEIDALHFKNVNFVISKGGPVEDLYLLSQCDLIMGPPSTFSCWASFYGNKPLCQIKDIHKPITLEDFVNLPPNVLYNF